MKKLLLFLLFLCSCVNEISIPIKITKIEYRNLDSCFYCIRAYATDQWFVDKCGKYNINDTLYLTKTKELK